jgi:hypothetical protein
LHGEVKDAPDDDPVDGEAVTEAVNGGELPRFNPAAAFEDAVNSRPSIFFMNRGWQKKSHVFRTKCGKRSDKTQGKRERCVNF